MHNVALGAGQAGVFQTRSSSLRTRVKDVLARAGQKACSCVYVVEDQALGDKGVFSMEKLSLIFKLSQAFNSLIRPEDLLPSIMAQTKEVFQAESCSLLLWDEKRHELFFPAISDLNPTLEEHLKAI